ncbi:MAG: hypothetical protein QW469_01205 [Candidatus Aenigmatarchaeota archaeon]
MKFKSDRQRKYVMAKLKHQSGYPIIFRHGVKYYYRSDRGWTKPDLKKDMKIRAKEKRKSSDGSWIGDLPGKKV